jgi:all-trans-retinol 13,14-reductase
MSDRMIDRREFAASILGGLTLLPLDWSSLPIAKATTASDDLWDAVIIGSGLGGLSCAACFARQGFKALVLEQHDRAGGYATSFKRPSGFEFDVSLHSTSVGERNGVRNLIDGFPEITDIEFLPHPNLYRAIFPDYDIRVPQRNVKAFVNLLAGYFPDEREGIERLFGDMSGVAGDIAKFTNASGKVDLSRFPADFPDLYKSISRTWGQMVSARIANPKLQAIVSSLWGYYGLPPSKLASFYYAMPTIGYLTEGGYYPRGRSQNISNAFVKYTENRGGKVMRKSRVDKILVKGGAAYGVVTADGHEWKGKAIVSNASAHSTFKQILGQEEQLREYLAVLDRYSISLSSFQIFLGLKQDLIREIGISDSEIFVVPGYDADSEYRAALNADVENGGFGITLYDNVYNGYSPAGKNTLNIMVLQGYGHWEKYEADYFKGNKTAYRMEKERMADILISRVEKKLLPGLSKAIAVKEIGTPLTNVRYTSNYRGAIYGWDQTLDNSGTRRLSHVTPIKNLYLSGAWTRPGHGYGGVLSSGTECFGEIMRQWQ